MQPVGLRLLRYDLEAVMAKAKNPLFSQEAYGPMGGILFRRGTYGAVISRTSGTPHLMTPAQTQQRARLAAAHKAYDALTDANREAWAAIATYPETGRNAYIRAYTVLTKVGFTPTPSPSLQPPAGHIYNPYYGPSPLPPGVNGVNWSYSGDAYNIVYLYILTTWSHRDTPKPSKLHFKDGTAAYHCHIDYLPSFHFPRTWFRLQLYSRYTGVLLDQALFHVDNL